MLPPDLKPACWRDDENQQALLASDRIIFARQTLSKGLFTRQQAGLRSGGSKLRALQGELALAELNLKELLCSAFLSYINNKNFRTIELKLALE